MKVLMAESTDIYHDGRVLKEAGSLADAGYAVKIFGFRSAKSVILKFLFSVSTLPVISRRYRFFRNISIMINVALLNARILFEKADFYHAHNVMFLFGMFVSSRIHKGKFIYDCHEVQHEAGRLQGRLEARYIQKPDLIINVSEGRARLLAAKFELDADKIVLIHNYPVLPDINYVKQPIKNPVRLIYCGGFDLLDNKLDAFLRIILHIPDVSLDLLAFGYRGSHETMEALIVELGLSDRVRFLPLVPLPKLIPTLMEYDVAVDMLTNPENKISKRYPAINKMYEYLAAGLPIICSNMPAFEEELVARGVAVSIDPAREEAAAAKITAFIADRDRLSQMKDKARALALDNFNWKSEGLKLVEAYSHLQS